MNENIFRTTPVLFPQYCVARRLHTTSMRPPRALYCEKTPRGIAANASVHEYRVYARYPRQAIKAAKATFDCKGTVKHNLFMI